MREAIENAFPQVIQGGCLETTTKTEFHIFDNPQDPKRCFIKQQNEEPEHFTVKNLQSKEVYFLAIDKCIFSDKDASRCDFAIFDDSKFCFVEIKETARAARRKEARKKAKSQLGKTILEFIKCGISFDNKNLEAIICFVGNPERPSINAQQQDAMLEFEMEFGAILSFESSFSFNQ